MNYQALNDRSLAVVMNSGGRKWTISGTAKFVADVSGRLMLRVAIDPKNESTELLIDEEVWKPGLQPCGEVSGGLRLELAD